VGEKHWPETGQYIKDLCINAGAEVGHVSLK
jgi:hypothetical protein